ncbi:MAG: hypothetical protein IJE94_05270 [Oscillospiraceae bacterium]|nr:hypothetical protein [Oscillospiraceae bacterium]
MGAVFLTLLHMSLAASALVVVVVVLRLLLKRAPKAIHCALWAMVALRLLLPFSVESSFSLIPQDVAEGELLTEWQDDYVGEVTVIYDDSALYQDAVAAGREPFADGEGGYYVVTAPDRLDAPDTVETAVLPILGWVWLAGCAAMLLYAAVSFFRIRKRVQLSLPLRDNIWRCEAVDSPFILGFFRPNIYLPYDMDEGQAQYVIAHEEAHLRRRDHWWKPLGFLLLAVYWFNPLLWVAYILLCRDIELACDERVIRDMDASAKKAYSEALLSCSLPRHMVAACPLAFGEVGVKKRIASVLHYKKPAFWVMVVAILACVVVAVCFLTNPKDTIGGKVYTYEKSGVLGNFTISLFEDGTFHYTEGMASSYLATGKWTEKGNILTLTDDENLGYKLVNRFRKDGDTLYFIAEGSSNFLYVTVQDGERFTYTFDTEIPIPEGDWDIVQTVPIPSYAIVNGTLTEEEIASLNELLAPIVYDKQGGIIGASPWSCFFTSYYRDVRALDFEKFMRYFPGDGSKASAEEFELLKGTEGWPFSQEDTLDTIPVPIHKYPARLVDAILLEYAGITTAEVDTSGVAYLEEYDAYYNYTSDFGAASFHCTSGERVGDLLYLYSETEQGTIRLTLREAGNSYHVLALQPVVNGETVADPLLAKAINQAILDHNKPTTPDGLYHCASFAVLSMEEISGTPASDSAQPKTQVTVYGHALHQAFGFSGHTFHTAQASHIPVALTFTLQDGNYILAEYWEPRSGNFYAEDIQNKFPDEIEEDALNNQKYLLSQTQHCYEQAIEYGGVDAFYAVEYLFDVISSSPTTASRPVDYIDAHPAEYLELTYYGDYTLRYILAEFLKGGQTDLKGHLMRFVLDELAPEAQLRLHTETGQEYFDEWIKGADRMATDHGLEWLEGNQPALYMALQIRSEIYGHSSPFIPIDAPELPEPFDLDTVTYRAACDAILASLSTGWWTGSSTLSPAKEAAAFTCFFRLDIDGVIKLYGFGGYFSQDAQGNDDLSWCDFTLVTLNASTLQPISVWWPGDGGAHAMSIDEVFPGELAQAVNMSEDYQKLRKQLKKQAAENMVDAGLSLPDAQTRIFKRDGLELEVSGVRAVRQMNMVAEGVALHEYAVFVCDPNATITVLNADMSDPAYSEDGLPHPNWGLLYEDDTRVRITEETGTVPITPDLQCVYHLEAGLNVLDFEIVE